MKKVIYNLYQISPLDIGVGPSKFARYDAEILQADDGHGMRMSLYKRIFTETRQEVAKEMQRDVTDRDVLAEARHRVRVNRYEPDKKSSQIENSGIVEYDGVQQFTVVDGQARYVNPDGSLSEYTFESFHQRQLTDDNPEIRSKYSEESHHTDILLNSTIVNATGYLEVTKIAHDSRGVRDSYTYAYDPATKRGFIRILNMAPDGKNMSPSEAREKMKSLFMDRQEIRMGNNVSVLVKSKQSIDSTKVRSIYERTIRQAIDMPVQTGRAVYAETKSTIQSVDRYVQRIYSKHLQEVPMVIGDTLIHRVRRVFEQKEHRKEKKPVIHEINLHERSLGKEKNAQTKMREKIITSAAALLFVRATGVGMGGAFAQLESIIRLPKISLKSTKRINKEKQREQKHIVKKMQAFRMSEAFTKLNKKEQRVLRRKEKKLRMTEKKLFLKKEQRKTQNKERVPRKKEKQELARNEKVLWKILQRLVQKTERQFLPNKIKRKEQRQKIPTIKKEIRLTKKHEKQCVKDFSIALIIWLLLRPRENKKNIRVMKYENKIKRAEKEASPWILFAIIWHLAMIREGGMRTVPKQKKPKKQQTQYDPISMPPAGIIFAYAS